MANASEVDHKAQAGWVPSAQSDLEEWIAGHRERAEQADGPLHPVIVEFQRVIESDPLLRMNAERMIEQVPRAKQYEQRHLTDLPQLLRLMNEVLHTAPEFGEGTMVVTPLGAILDWTMGTSAGFDFYRDPRVNRALKQVLNVWAEFLNGPGSLSVLNDSPSGWKSAEAREAVGMDQFEYDPFDEHWGFTSWNDYFTRRFREGQRPVEDPDDDAVIVSACESKPYGLATDVQRRDRFWIKTQPYSLDDMLAHDETVEQFVGGTVYQAYLSATNYHRWHSPVSGTVVRAFVEDGTYYSEADSEGDDATEPTNSQSYLAHVATRAVILIEADDPTIGLMAVVQVGMLEVSSCVLDDALTPGTHLKKGDELGMFQFGGSTYCLVFRPGAIGDFALQAIPQPHDPEAPLVRVNSRIARAASAE